MKKSISVWIEGEAAEINGQPTEANTERREEDETLPNTMLEARRKGNINTETKT